MYMQGLTEAERKKPMNLAGIGGKGITEEISLEMDPERSGVRTEEQNVLNDILSETQGSDYSPQKENSEGISLGLEFNSEEYRVAGSLRGAEV